MSELQAPEAIPTTAVEVATAAPAGKVLVETTQVRRPLRSTIRTAFQTLLGLASLIPLVAAEVYDNPADYPAAVAQVVVVSSAITRAMATARAERLLRRFAPFLAAAPRPNKKEAGRGR